MKRKTDIFYGKVLLFGEYSILFNSKGLTIPYSHFTGQLSFINDDKYTDYDFAVQSNKQMFEFLEYMQAFEVEGLMPCRMDLKRLRHDLESGLYFESNIPQGYGIGSSGALVAAVYDRYCLDKIETDENISSENISRLRTIFSILESLFHGQSSGIDPLNCYIQHPLLINSRENISITGIPRSKFENEGVIFLVDTGKIGKTGPLVNHFLEQMRFKEYETLFRTDYIPWVNQCISDILNGRMKSFFDALIKVSEFQLQHFGNMIPSGFIAPWKWGLDTGTFQLKLCGSGGGGFLLGFTTDYASSRKYFNNLEHEVIPVYKSGQ
ncbi:MAG: mevalonate kinase [Bacteroidales bacterium]|nr:mevalonate kinase [Bacteroidales bacterium]